jgi:hypothetical protein
MIEAKTMKIYFLFYFFLLSGCVTNQSLFLRTKCGSDESYIGQYFAEQTVSLDRFDEFSKYCSDNNLGIPNKEKFMFAYERAIQPICANKIAYFKSSYESYVRKSSPLNCSGNADIEAVKDDAQFSYERQKEIKYIDQKLEQVGFDKEEGFWNYIVNQINGTDEKSLRDKRRVEIEKLKSVLQRYNLYVADLSIPL